MKKVDGNYDFLVIVIIDNRADRFFILSNDNVTQEKSGNVDLSISIPQFNKYNIIDKSPFQVAQYKTDGDWISILAPFIIRKLIISIWVVLETQFDGVHFCLSLNFTSAPCSTRNFTSV